MTEADRVTPPAHLQYAIVNIFRCLAPCGECSGGYISELIEKRFVCYCICHKKKDNEFRASLRDVRGR